VGQPSAPPGFIDLGHQQVLPNVLAGFERTEAEVAAEGSHCATGSPALLGSENVPRHF
jgi:gamma-glutamylcysteine synthetase